MQSEQVLGGHSVLAARLADMEDAADREIERAAAAPGDAELRHAQGELAIFWVMRPEFGPANAALFNARGKKLVALARALGVSPAVEREQGPDLDDFVAALRTGMQQVAGAGFAAALVPATSAAIDWRPVRAGYRLNVRDERRVVRESIPYAAPSATAPREVHPSISLFWFPPAPMSAIVNRVSREQPGEMEAALPGALLFTLQAPQSLDQDPDGSLLAAVRGVLFPEPAPGAPSSVAIAGLGDASLRRGVLVARTRGKLADPLVAVQLAGAHALLTVLEDGVTAELSVHPLAPR